MNKKYTRHAALMGFPMSANERRLGRYIRDESGHQNGPTGQSSFAPAGTQQPPENNQQVNLGNQQNPTNPDNNTGPAALDEQFWQQDPDQSQQPQQQDPKEFGTQMGKMISDFNAGQLFTPEILSQMQDGNFDNANQVFGTAIQSALSQSLQMNIKVAERFGTAILAKVESMISASQDGVKNESTLLEAIPSYKNPVYKPVIDSVYQQALSRNNNDRAKAIQQTKALMAGMLNDSKDSLGISFPADDSSRNGTVDWSKLMDQ